MISPLKDVIGTYMNPDDYKKLMKIEPDVYTEQKLIKSELSRIPEYQKLKFVDVYNEAEKLIELYKKYISLCANSKYEIMVSKSIKIDPLYVVGIILSDFIVETDENNKDLINLYVSEILKIKNYLGETDGKEIYLANISIRCSQCSPSDRMYDELDDMIETKDANLYSRFRKYLSDCEDDFWEI